jgi:hypothetical protein
MLSKQAAARKQLQCLSTAVIRMLVMQLQTASASTSLMLTTSCELVYCHQLERAWRNTVLQLHVPCFEFRAVTAVM